MFFYRQDLFEKYKLGAAQDVGRSSGCGEKIGAGEKMFGYVMRAAPGNAVVADFMPLLWAFGGDVLDASGKAGRAIHPQPLTRCDSCWSWANIRRRAMRDSTRTKFPRTCCNRRAAMSINWPAWIAAMDDPAKSKVVGKIEFSPMPASARPGVGELGAWLVAVPAGFAASIRRVRFYLLGHGAPRR